VIEPSSLGLLFRRWERKVELSQQSKQAVADLPWTVRSFPREDYLVREGEPAQHCMLLTAGYAYRQKLVADGSRQIISFHIPGEFVDIQNAMLDVADHNVQSLGRSTVAAVNKEALNQLMARDEDVRRAIWLDSLIDASVFREWVVNVGRRDARTRIAHLLCELALRIDTSGIADGAEFDFPLTQEQLADATGLTAVHTNRVLQALRKDGLIGLSSNRLQVRDWKALADTGDFSERYLHHGT
jgi:CRP-like cAMP-binding protein